MDLTEEGLVVTVAAKVYSRLNRQILMSVSSHRDGSKRRTTADRSTENQASLSAVLNDPRTNDKQSAWFFRPPDASWIEQKPPPIDSSKYPTISRVELGSQFMQLVTGGKHDQFVNDRLKMAEGLAQQLVIEEGSSSSGDGLAQAMQLVPSQYFQEDYSLLSPGVFKALLAWKEGEDEEDAVGTGSGVQRRIEQLSSYLDNVETQLMREIACRSKQLFEAASELHALHRMLCQTMDKIKTLREHLSAMDEHSYATALTVTSLQRRRRNLEHTVELLVGIEEVADCRNVLQCLLESQDYAGALEMLGNLRHLAKRQEDLGIRAFKETGPQVEETTELVESLLGCEFLSHAHVNSRDLVRVVERAMEEAEFHGQEEDSSLFGGDSAGATEAEASGLMSASSSEWPPKGKFLIRDPLSEESSALREQLHDVLLPLILGLQRCGRLPNVLSQMKENMVTEVKKRIREVLEEMVSPLLAAVTGTGAGDLLNQASTSRVSSGGNATTNTAAGDSEMAESLQMLPHSSFMKILVVIFRVAEACLHHSCLIGGLVLDVIKSTSGAGTTSRLTRPSSSSSQQQALTLTSSNAMQLSQAQKDVVAIIQAVSDAAQARWTRLLSARATSHAKLRLPEFKQLIFACERLAALPEGSELYISGARASGALRAAIQSQCRSFLEHTHTKGSIQLQQLLEGEQWVAVEVPASIQSMVNRLISHCSTGPRVKVDSKGGPASSQKLKLNGQQFHVVTSLLILLKLLDEYLILQESVPLFSSEVAHRATELLKTYNTTSCQLVLGAGAMRTAGLKSISAKHLAVCSQAILMLSAALPFLRVGLTSPLPPQRQQLLIPEFDHLQQDLVLHVEEIHGKLVDIMQDRLQMAAKQVVVEAETWGLLTSSPSSDPSSSSNGASAGLGEPSGLPPSESIKSLAKQLNTLRTVLTPIIQPEEVQFIFGRVASMCSETLAATFDGLHFSNKGSQSTWEEQRRCNATFALQCLSELPVDLTLASTYTSRMATFCTKHYGIARKPKPAEPSSSAPAENGKQLHDLAVATEVTAEDKQGPKQAVEESTSAGEGRAVDETEVRTAEDKTEPSTLEGEGETGLDAAALT